MNERIRELAKQADDYERKLGKGIGPTKDEKFAELIVKECIDVVAMRIYLGPEEICRQECKALASEIKQHFGVEE
jgi:hypothetical protein